jgi:hypothetical protein
MRRCSLTYKTMSPELTHLVFNIAKHHQLFLCRRIITKSIAIGVHAPIYFDLPFQFWGAPFKFHNFWFCANDMNCCMGGMKHRNIVERLTVLSIWHVQGGTNFSHDEVKVLEEVRFVINIQQPILPWTLFAGKSFFLINWLTNVMSCPKTQNGKHVWQPFTMSKLHYNWWEVGWLFVATL